MLSGKETLSRHLLSGDDTLCRPNDHLPGAAFSLSCKKIWEVIRTQKDLNLPAHKVRALFFGGEGERREGVGGGVGGKLAHTVGT